MICPEPDLLRMPYNVPAFLYAAVRNRGYDLLKGPGAVSIESLDQEILSAPPDDLERIEKLVLLALVWVL